MFSFLNLKWLAFQKVFSRNKRNKRFWFLEKICQRANWISGWKSICVLGNIQGWSNFRGNKNVPIPGSSGLEICPLSEDPCHHFRIEHFPLFYKPARPKSAHTKQPKSKKIAYYASISGRIISYNTSFNLLIQVLNRGKTDLWVFYCVEQDYFPPPNHTKISFFSIQRLHITSIRPSKPFFKAARPWSLRECPSSEVAMVDPCPRVAKSCQIVLSPAPSPKVAQ